MLILPPLPYLFRSVVWGTVFASAALYAAQTPPPEKFLQVFAPLDAGPVSISPDGTHVAIFLREKHGPVVSIVNLSSGQTVFRAVVGKEDNQSWVGETRHTEPV